MDGADCAYGAGCDGEGDGGFGFADVCAQAGATTIKAAANAALLKRWFMDLISRWGKPHRCSRNAARFRVPLSSKR
jgi:hypothetical protein